MTQEVGIKKEKEKQRGERKEDAELPEVEKGKKRGRRRIGHLGHVKVYVYLSILYLVYIAVSHVNIKIIFLRTHNI